MVDSDKILPHIPLGFLLGLLLMVGFLLREAAHGRVPPQLVTAAATFVLVAGTIYYAWQARKSTDQTEKTLEQMEMDRKKPGKILVIAFGIDPVLNELRTFQAYWERIHEEIKVGQVPGMDLVKIPDHIFVQDIDEHVNGFENRLERYVEYVTVYRDGRDELVSDMQDYIIENYAEIPDGSSADIHNAELSIRLFAQRLLSKPENEPRSEYLEEEGVWNEALEDLSPVEEHSEFGPQMDDVTKSLDGLDELIDDLIDDLESAKEDIRETYNITRMEIQEAKNTTDLAGPTIRIYERT